MGVEHALCNTLSHCPAIREKTKHFTRRALSQPSPHDHTITDGHSTQTARRHSDWGSPARRPSPERTRGTTGAIERVPGDRAPAPAPGAAIRVPGRPDQRWGVVSACTTCSRGSQAEATAAVPPGSAASLRSPRATHPRQAACAATRTLRKRVVPPVGIELTTYRLQGGCSTN